MNNKVAVLNTDMSVEQFVKENPQYQYSAEDNILRSRVIEALSFAYTAETKCWAFVFRNDETGKIHLTSEQHVSQEMMFDLLHKYGGEYYASEYDEKPSVMVEPKDILERYRLDRWCDNEFPYMMLDRLRTDCDYYLGRGERNSKWLWATYNEREHIDIMKALWERLPDDGKPEWLPYEKILEYEEQMCGCSADRSVEQLIADAAGRSESTEKSEASVDMDKGIDV